MSDLANICHQGKQSMVNTDFEHILILILKLIYRKTPLLVPGVDQFSNSNSFVLDQLVTG
jgi:hypothetical protein